MCLVYSMCVRASIENVYAVRSRLTCRVQLRLDPGSETAASNGFSPSSLLPTVPLRAF